MSSREQFEAWFENDVVGAEVTFPAFADGEYVDGDLYDDQFYFMLQAMWMSWQAATKQADDKCAALAAENAALKSAVEFATAPDMWEDMGGNVMRYQYKEWYADKLKSAMQFPATDAFLAEVRASARNDFIGRIEWIIRNECNPDKTEAIISELQKFSDELKQGAAQ